jgi:hypothetical protein
VLLCLILEASYSLTVGRAAVWVAIQPIAVTVQITHKIPQFKVQNVSLHGAMIISNVEMAEVRGELKNHAIF